MLSRGFLLSLLYALVLVGYPLVAGLMSLLGIGDARGPSIALRVATAVVALLCLIASRTSLRPYSPVFLVSFLVFWSLYWMRILTDAYWMPAQLPMPADELVVATLLFTFMPALGGFIGLSSDYARRVARWVLIVGGAALVLLFLNSAAFGQLSVAGDMNRFSLEKINPISVSLAGALVLVVAVAQAFSPTITSPIHKGLLLVLAGAGLLVLLLGNSKGPTIAAGLALLVYALVPLTPVRVVIGGVAAAALVFIALSMESTLSSDYGINVVERFRQSDTSSSVESRSVSFQSAWQIFQTNPIFGGPVMEPTTGYYPHNTVLEALMATGVVGGVCFMVCLVLAALACVRALQARRGHEWLALVCVVEMVAFQFSGSHYASGQLWLVMAAIVFTERRAAARVAAGVSSARVARGQLA